MSECPNTLTDEETDYEDVDPASLQMMTQNYSPVDSEGEEEYLNLWKARMAPTPFLPMKDKTGGKVNYIKTERQADHV